VFREYPPARAQAVAGARSRFSDRKAVCKADRPP